MPDFALLQPAMRESGDIALLVFAFDLLELDGRDLRGLPLVERKRKLSRLIERSDVPDIRYVASFERWIELLEIAREFGLEGIVSKRATAPYRSGRRPDWIKVKCEAWRVANRERWRSFMR